MVSLFNFWKTSLIGDNTIDIWNERMKKQWNEKTVGAL